MTAIAALTALEAAPPVVKKLVQWLETGHVPVGLFTADVFCDLTVPTWRLQAQGADAVAAMRRASHPAPGRVPRLRYDPTPSGFVLEWEEEWDEHGDHWYCREMLRADVSAEAISSVSVYCTGDWSTAHQARHAGEVSLLRP
ncbi:MAG: hypothetical protein QOI69_3767 [Pseudonocardiales bacterium]|nr:hypothetical protein [Pseudonocardiales bacterium]